MDFTKLFEKNILDRGYEYYNSNEVKLIGVHNNIVEAEVSGSETYKVSVDLRNFNNMSCTCAYYKSGNNCKHMAAVLFYIKDHTVIKTPGIDQYLNNIGKMPIEYIINDINKIVEKEISEFDAYKSFDYITKLFERLQDYKNNGISYYQIKLLEKMEAMIIEYPEINDDLFTWLLNNVNTTNINIRNVILAMLLNYFKGEEYVDRFLAIIDPLLKNTQDPSFSLYLEIKIVLLDKNNRKYELDELCQSYKDHSTIRIYLVNKYVNEERYDDALKLAESSKILFRANKKISYKFGQAILKIYYRKRDLKAMVDEMWSLILDDKINDIKLYRELKKNYDLRQWAVERKRIFEANVFDIKDLYVEEKMYKELRDEVMKSSGFNALLKYDQYIKVVYCKDLLMKYEYEITHFKGKITRNEINQIINHITSYPGGKEFLAKLKEKNPKNALVN